MSAVIKRLLLASMLLVLGVLGSNTSKWIVSLMPTATEQDMEQVKKWIHEHNYKVTDTISEYQLRVLFVEADNGIEKLETDEKLRDLIDTVEVEDDHEEL